MILDKKFKDFLLNDKSNVSLAISITNSDDLDHIKVTDDGSISYRGKEKATDEDPWAPKGRTKVKPGKFINKVLGEIINAGVLSTRDVENWVNKFKSHFTDLGEISIVAGDDIKWHYNSENYTAPRGGSLWSCMSGGECQNRFDLYAQNPDSVKLVVQYDGGGKVKTRALLWTLEDGRQLMDRIYYQSDYSYNTFLRLCQDNSWLNRDKCGSVKFKVPVANWAHKSYPYIDTMRFIEKDAKGNFFMTNHIEASKRDSAYVIPNGTAGYVINNHVEVEGQWVHRTKAGTCRVSGVGLLLENLIEVPRQGLIDKKLAEKDKWGNLYWKDDLVESKMQGGLLPRRASYQLKINGDWLGRKKYRKLVSLGKLEDGSAHYKNKTAWVLEANVERQQAEDARVKTRMIADILAINPRNRREDLTERSLTRLLEVLNYHRTANGIEIFDNIQTYVESIEPQVQDEN